MKKLIVTLTVFISTIAYAANPIPMVLLVGYISSSNCATEAISTPGCYEQTEVEGIISWKVFQAKDNLYVEIASGTGEVFSMQQSADVGRIIQNAIDFSSQVEIGGTTNRFGIYGTEWSVIITSPGSKVYQLNAGETFEIRDKEGALILRGNESTKLVEFGDDISITGDLSVTGTTTTTGVGKSLVSVTLDTAASVVLDSTACGRTVRVKNDADAIDYTLPAPIAGCAICFIDDAGGVITIDTAGGSDVIVLNGTALTAGNAIDSSGTRGDNICLLAKNTVTWTTWIGRGTWIDGGAD